MNSALRNLIVADQQRARDGFKAYGAPDPQYTGTYSTDLSQSKSSTSSAVVSFLIPTLVLFPGGNDGQEWISATMKVPSAEAVPLSSLFTNPTDALTTISALATSELVASNPLTAQVIAGDGGNVPEGLTAKPENYQHFVMTPAGLSIGFNTGQSGCEPCGRQLVTIDWDKISSLLSPQGKLLVSELR